MQRALVERAMAGDHEAFSELARLVVRRLYAVARLILRDADRAPLGSDIWLAVEHNSAPAGAGFLLGRGGWLYSEPCSDTEDPDVPVGPTVDDFVEALLAHPSLEVTQPIDMQLDGWSGRYLEIQAPADITACAYYQAWAPTFYAQGASNLWPIWVLDVDGVRVVIHGSQFPGTTAVRVAELRAIVESMRIDFVTAEPTDPSPASSSVS